LKQGNFIIKDYEALGTVWYIELFGLSSSNTAQELKKRLTQEIEDFQKKYSRFNELSLLNILNREKRVIFDSDLYNMLEQGEKWREETDGVFDIAIKEKLEDIGYGEISKDSKTEVSQEERASLSRVSRDEDNIFWNSTLQIDLGGIGKGYLIDMLSSILKEEYKQEYFLINGGGDIFATSDEGEPIEILLEHPTEQDSYIGKIYVQNESLCVSSSFKRVWKQANVVRNHFIDTKDNLLIESASFVIAPNATDADVLATVFAIVEKDTEHAISLSMSTCAEYLTIGKTEQVNASERFKDALKAI
jgi:thiamine biosynthesis lipoprotein ApbE